MICFIFYCSIYYCYINGNTIEAGLYEFSYFSVASIFNLECYIAEMYLNLGINVITTLKIINTI